MARKLPIALLLLAALVSGVGAQKKLPELEQLENVTEVIGQRNQYGMKGRKGMLGFDEVLIKKASLGNKEVFLVQQVGEFIDPVAGRISHVSTASLWNADLGLIVSRFTETHGKKKIVTTYRWQDGKLSRKVGRKKAKIVPTQGRPQADEDVQIQVGKIKDGSKGKLLVLDHEGSRVIENEFEVKDRYEFELGDKKFPVTLVETSRQGGARFYFGEDRRIYHFELEKLLLTGGLVELTAKQCRRMLARNPLLQQPAVKRFKAGWKGTTPRFRNTELGLAMKLPKGWNRLDKASEKIIFVAESFDRRAALFIMVEVVGKAFDNDEYAKAFRSVLLPKVLPKDEVAVADIKAGNRKAKELTYKQKSDKTYLTMRAIVLVEKGTAIRLVLSAETGREDNFKKEFEDFLKSLRFTN